MSVASEIAAITAKLNTILDQVKTELAAKGVTGMPSTYSDVPAKIRSIVTGSGIDTSDATAVAGDIRTGKTAYVDGSKLTGTLVPGVDTSDATASLSDIRNGKTAYVNGAKITGTLPTVQMGKPVITLSSNSSKLTINASTTQNSGYVSGGTESADSKTIDVVQTTEIVPSASGQTIYGNKYLKNDLSVPGNANFVASNIKKNVTIWGVTGTYDGGGGVNPSDATATSGDILSGKTAYVNGGKTTGTMPIVQQAIPTIGFDEVTGIITASTTQSAGYVGAGSASTTSALTVALVSSITPMKNPQSIGAHQYLLNDVNIEGDNNFVAQNIKQGVTIWGVTGTYSGSGGIDTSDATAEAQHILYPKTAYAGGSKITGSMMPVTITAPTITWNNTGVFTTQVVQSNSGYVESGSTATYSIQLPVLAGQTIRPTAIGGRIAQNGTIVTGDVILESDADFTANNIARGVTIWGVTGTYDGAANVSVDTALSATTYATVQETYFSFTPDNPNNIIGVSVRYNENETVSITGTISHYIALKGPNNAITVFIDYLEGGTKSMRYDNASSLVTIDQNGQWTLRVPSGACFSTEQGKYVYEEITK